MRAALKTNTIKRLEANGVTVADSGGKFRPHRVLGEDVTDDELYMLANFVERFRAMSDETVSAIVGREVKAVK